MSGYVPVFDTVFQGTLCGRWPDSGVWLCLLALADKHGNIDMTVPYISAVTGVPADVLTGCIERFMQPDPHSRTKDEDGRRLVRLDESRSWGWRIVNHAKYREKARKQAYDSERTASGKDADRKKASRDVPTRPDVSRDVPLSDTDTNPQRGRARKSKNPASKRCPQEFQVTEDLMAWAKDNAPGVNLSRETAKLREHEFKTPRSDWAATWRKWMLTAADNAPAKPKGSDPYRNAI